MTPTSNPIRDRSPRRGFTLVELMIVVVIIAVLVGLGIREYVVMAERARLNRAKQDLRSLADAIRNYNHRERLPFFKGRNLKTLAGRYIEKLPRDPWGHDYAADGTFVFSLGPDGKPSSDDLRLRYERESIVINPTFATSRRLERRPAGEADRPGPDEGGEIMPTSWTFNPRALVTGERGGNAGVDVVRGDAGTVSGGNALMVR